MGKIYEFNPQIYPTRLWVAKATEVSWDELGRNFYALNDENERVDFVKGFGEPNSNAYASTYPVSNKKTGWRGCLVILHRKEATMGTVAHEASHCADWLLEALGVESGTTFNNGEARAYYTEWVFNRIQEVKQGKAKQ